ncbi:MAG: hypothetical protein ACKOFZ_04310 [Ilumatobacteraceae bacterium]
MTTSETIVVGTHEWSLVERVRSGVTFVVGVSLLVASNVLHERWLTFLGVTTLGAFAYVASTSGRVVHISRDRLETVSPFGVRTLLATDVAQVSAIDDPFGTVTVVVHPRVGRPLSIAMRAIAAHPEGMVALHQFVDHAIGAGRLDPARVSLKNELAFY